MRVALIIAKFVKTLLLVLNVQWVFLVIQMDRSVLHAVLTVKFVLRVQLVLLVQRATLLLLMFVSQKIVQSFHSVLNVMHSLV